MARRAVFRVDASAVVGNGHLFRCRNLAAALRSRGFDIGYAASAATLAFMSAQPGDGDRVMTMPDDVMQEPAAMRAAWTGSVDALIVDHYGRDDAFEAACRPWARAIVAIDDVPQRRHDADMLLDQTLGRSPDEYRGLVPDGARLAVGGDYILLRRDLRGVRRAASRVPPVARHLVVTFGSADVRNVSARALVALGDPRLQHLSATLVVGPGNERLAALRAAAPANCRVLFNPPDFAAVLAGADCALTAAGTTCWELAYLGVPAIVVTESPGTVGPALQAAGAARWLGPEAEVNAVALADALSALLDDRPARQAMADAGRRVVDGNGAERAATAIEELVST